MEIKTTKIVKGLTDTILIPSSEDVNKKFVRYQTIDTTIDDEKLINTLAIIRGDIYQACKGVNDKCIVIWDWETEDILGSMNTLIDYLESMNISFDEVPVFLVSAIEFIDTHISELYRIGFETANHLVDLENNVVLIITSKNNHKKLCKNIAI